MEFPEGPGLLSVGRRHCWSSFGPHPPLDPAPRPPPTPPRDPVDGQVQGPPRFVRI